MEIEFHRGEIGRLVLSGELDLHTAPRVERRLMEAIYLTDGPLLIDLEDCTFIDSTGLRILLKGHREMNGAPGRMAVACSPAVWRVIELSGLAVRLGAFASLAEARAALES